MQNPVGVFDKIAYLFSGGGALGAYQVGIFKGLSEAGYHPDWLIGTSIGSINSAIIAGNRPQDRIKQLLGFWDTISTKMPPTIGGLNNIVYEQWQHFLSAQYTELVGQPGFFKPRDINPWLGIASSTDQLSYYTTDELRDTLLKYINFDIINQQDVRLSMGAVRISTGRLMQFDNTVIEIGPEHVMASGALPPGFPAVEIDDHLYWDGGVHSNTQLNLLLCQKEPLDYLCFMVNLFDSYGEKPTNMDQVLKRMKDITYSSHHRQSIQIYKTFHALQQAIQTLGSHLSKDILNDPEMKKLIDLGKTGKVHLARFHRIDKMQSALSSQDYEFSAPSIQGYIEDGVNDVVKVLRDPPWKKPYPDNIGLVLSELADNHGGADDGDSSPFVDFIRYHVTS